MTAALTITSHQEYAHRHERLVGAIVWADAELGAAKLLRREVRERLLANGLDPELQPEDPTPQAAFGHALNRADLGDGWKVEREEPRSRKALLFRTTGAGVSRIDAACVSLRATDQGITTEPERPLLTPEQADALAPLDAAYNERLLYLTSNEVQDLLRRALKSLHATRIRPHSGTYYVPAQSIEPARRLARTLETLGGTRVVVLPLYDGQAAEVQRDLADGFERERRAIVEELMALSADDGTRASTYTARAEALDELTARVMVATEVLGARQRELVERLNAARRAAVDLVSGLAADWNALLGEV